MSENRLCFSDNQVRRFQGGFHIDRLQNFGREDYGTSRQNRDRALVVPTGACQAVSPHSGKDPLREGWSSRKETDGVRIGALLPRASGRAVRLARLVFMGSFEIRETPVWNMTIN